MRVLMLSTDRNILREGSESRQRMIEYGSLFEELHIIVYTNRELRIKNYELRIAPNVFAYPTRSRFNLLYFFNAYKIAKRVIHDSYFVIHNSLITTQDPFETGLVGYWLKKKFKLSLQIQIHTDFLSPYFWQESLKNKIRVLLGKWLVKKADCIRVVSGRIKKSILSRLNLNSEVQPRILPKIDVLPIFVDVEKIKNTPIKTDLRKKYPGYDFIILIASRLTKEKNINLAIEAMAAILRKSDFLREVRLPKIEPLLLIIGDGPERRRLELRIKNYELINNVKIESWTDDLASYYKTADLFLNTSDYEGYGRTIIEALAAGCPVVSTNVGITAEFIKPGQSGIIIEPKDINGLVSALSEVMSNKVKFKGILEGKIIKNKDEYLRLYKEALWCTSLKNAVK